MKNSVKRALSLIALGAVAASACSLNAFAEGTSADGGFSEAEIAASPVKPVLTASKSVIDIDDIKNNEQTISLEVKDADAKYASTGIHVFFDDRLELVLDRFGNPAITYGPAAEYLPTRETALDFTLCGDEKPDLRKPGNGLNGVFVATAAKADYGLNGTLFSFNVALHPEAVVKEGDVLPIDIIYRTNGKNVDLFKNTADDKDGKLMQAYTWTKGIFNAENANFKADAADIEKCPGLANIAGDVDGYIAIAGAVETTTTTTTSTTTTTTTTTTKPTTTTTKPTTTTTKPATTTTTSDVATTTTTVSGEATTTTTSDAATTTTTTTTTNKTTAKKTTTKKTTAKKDDSPKTGVAGAGVAVAGLAVALGTAFVLRKKED